MISIEIKLIMVVVFIFFLDFVCLEKIMVFLIFVNIYIVINIVFFICVIVFF